MSATIEGGELTQHLNTETGILEMIDASGKVVKAYDMKGDFKVEEVSITPEGYKANPIPNDNGFVPQALKVEEPDDFSEMEFGDEEKLSPKQEKIKSYDEKAATLWERAKAQLPEESPAMRTIFDQIFLGNLENAEQLVSSFEEKESPASESNISEYHYDKETQQATKIED